MNIISHRTFFPIFTFIVIIAILAISTCSFLSQTYATSTFSSHGRHHLVLFLQGITTTLDDQSANSGHIVGLGSVPETLHYVFAQPSTRLLEYSYSASSVQNGLPTPYTCTDTITHSLFSDIVLLDQQIKHAMRAQPAATQVDITLIGHSLGGVIALGYLAFLEHKGFSISLPANAHLEAVITLDSPIGGVSAGFLTSFSLLGRQILEHQCPAAKGKTFTAMQDLETIFHSASTTFGATGLAASQGSKASLLSIAPSGHSSATHHEASNQSVLERAKTDLATSVLTIGNLNDFLFDPKACAAVLPSFLDTQFLLDEGRGSGLYGRMFNSGPNICPSITRLTTLNRDLMRTTQVVMANHTAVLSNPSVQQGITHFLQARTNNHLGGTPIPLLAHRLP
ncbi:MAG: hypothetical protein E6J34_19335 [Chloroflexi bacterium]|nr:MAG: hypothetical protein E6J34_19335 [Chloroflexota bacterium]